MGDSIVAEILARKLRGESDRWNRPKMGDSIFWRARVKTWSWALKAALVLLLFAL